MAYTITTPPAFLEPFGERLADLTQAELQQPVDISTIAPKVAGISPLIQAAQQRTATQAGIGALQFDPTTGEITSVGQGTGIAAYEPYLQAAQASAGPTAYQQYMSPYQQEVINATQRLLDEQRAKGLIDVRGSQVAQGAFGQGRGQIGEAEYLRGRDISDAATMAALRQQGLTEAQRLAQQNVANQLNFAQQQQNLASGITSQLGATGTGAQTYSQALLEAQRQGNVLGLEYPLQRLGTATNIFGGIFSGTPQQPGQPVMTSPVVPALQTFAGLYGGVGQQQQQPVSNALGGIYNIFRGA